MQEQDTLNSEKEQVKDKTLNLETVRKKGYKLTKLGWIPEEWEVMKLGDICIKFLNGGTPSTKIGGYWNGNIPWITGADFENQSIKVIRKFINIDAVKKSATNIIPKGWLLVVTRTGVGKMSIAPFDIAISQDITGILVNQELIATEYIFRYLDFNSEKLTKSNQGTSISGITRDSLIALEFPHSPSNKK